ncbi:MAG: hypothetical protein M1839_001464 [Geoglossum umbratile]|nr:MAG: hypothetical protein M1839_001464 [Geoglossum umbratile]
MPSIRKHYPLQAEDILLSQFFLPLSAVSLGRFVISLDDPYQDFHNPLCNSGPEVTERVQTQYDSIRHSIKHQNVASQLTTFLSSSFSKRLKASVWITADRAKTYYLNNAGQWFRDAVQSKETQKWIEGTIDEGEDIYVVVAYHTLFDARIIEQLGGQSAASGNLAIPVSTVLTASGVVVPFTNIADCCCRSTRWSGIVVARAPPATPVAASRAHHNTDPGLSGFRDHIEDEQRQFIAPGEQIYAVQYRKVRWRWFTSNKVDEMTLAKKAWWERYDRPRYLESESEDMIEVELEDEIALEVTNAPTEYVAARAFLDEKHDRAESVSNVYTLGKVGRHNVVIAVLPDGEYGIAAAASVAGDMLNSFPNVRFGLMVGIGGGAPNQMHDIRLGDIVVSAPRNGMGGVFQYDFGKAIQDQKFQITGFLNQPPVLLWAAVTDLAAQYEEEGHQLEDAINAVLGKMPKPWKKYKRPDQSSDRLYQSGVIRPQNDESACAAVCGDRPYCDPNGLKARIIRQFTMG